MFSLFMVLFLRLVRFFIMVRKCCCLMGFIILLVSLVNFFMYCLCLNGWVFSGWVLVIVSLFMIILLLCSVIFVCVLNVFLVGLV